MCMQVNTLPAPVPISASASAGGSSSGKSSTPGPTQPPPVSTSAATVDALAPPPALVGHSTHSSTASCELPPGFDANESSLHETIQMLDHSVLQLDDLVDAQSLSSHIRTRLYFTSESHIQSIMNALRQWSVSEACPAFLASLLVPDRPVANAHCFVVCWLVRRACLISSVRRAKRC